MKEDSKELEIWMGSRQQGKTEAMRRFIESLPLDTKVVVIGKDHPRPPFLGSPFDLINYPIPAIGDAWMNGAPIDYKTSIPSFEMRDDMVKAAMSKALIAQARVDIPDPKPNWRKNRMGFLDGLNRKKY